MLMLIKNGFTISDSGKRGPVFVAPHASPAFHKPDYYQDQGTHYIANMLAEMNGGKALISTITREKDIGIDFFRQAPTASTALKYYKYFLKYHSSKKLWTKKTFHFRKKYAWVARDAIQHEEKKHIYNTFWNEIKESKAAVFFIHRQYLNPKNHPSIIDVIPFNHKRQTQIAIRKTNKKYEHIFTSLMPLYMDAFYFKTRCLHFKVALQKETKMMFFDHLKPRLRDRIERFDNKVKKYPELKITCMKNFRGDVVRPVINKIIKEMNSPVIHMEVSEFLCKWLPDLAVYIISDLINKIMVNT